MAIFKKRIDIGKAIASKVKLFPVFSKEPKKKPARWAECPEFKIKPPKASSREERDRDYSYSVSVYSRNHSEIYKMLDYMIECGKEPIEAERIKLQLHAVRHSVHRIRGTSLFLAKIRYIFRAEQCPEEIL